MTKDEEKLLNTAIRNANGNSALPAIMRELKTNETDENGRRISLWEKAGKQVQHLISTRKLDADKLIDDYNAYKAKKQQPLEIRVEAARCVGCDDGC